MVLSLTEELLEVEKGAEVLVVFMDGCLLL